MHELSVCLSLLGQLERIAGEEHSTAVTRLELGVGPLSGIEPALLRQAFPLAVAGTVAEGAVLDIVTIGVRVRCTVCEAESDTRANKLVCQSCGDFRTRLISGDELLLNRVELVPAQPGCASLSAG